MRAAVPETQGGPSCAAAAAGAAPRGQRRQEQQQRPHRAARGPGAASGQWWSRSVTRGTIGRRGSRHMAGGRGLVAARAGGAAAGCAGPAAAPGATWSRRRWRQKRRSAVPPRPPCPGPGGYCSRRGAASRAGRRGAAGRPCGQVRRQDLRRHGSFSGPLIFSLPERLQALMKETDSGAQLPRLPGLGRSSLLKDTRQRAVRRLREPTEGQIAYSGQGYRYSEALLASADGRQGGTDSAPF